MTLAKISLHCILKEIPVLLPISKIKPKTNIQNTGITQICGSMVGKEVSHFT